MQARLPTYSENALDQAGITSARTSHSSDSTLEGAIAAADAQLERSMAPATHMTAFYRPGVGCTTVDDAGLELAAAYTAGALQTKPMRPICIADADAALEQAMLKTAAATKPPVFQYIPGCISSGDIALEKSLSSSAQPTVKGWPYCVTDTDSALEGATVVSSLRTIPYNLSCASSEDNALEQSMTAAPQPTYVASIPSCPFVEDAALEFASADTALRTLTPNTFMPCISAGDAELENSLSASAQPTRYGWPNCLTGTDSALERSVAMSAPVTTPWAAFPRHCAGSEDANLEASATATAMRTALMGSIPPCFTADDALERITLNAAPSVNPYVVRCATKDVALERVAANSIHTLGNPYLLPHCIADGDTVLEHAAADLAARTNPFNPLLPCIALGDSTLENTANGVSPYTYSRTPMSPRCVAAVSDSALEHAATDIAARTNPIMPYLPCIAMDDAEGELSANLTAAIHTNMVTARSNRLDAAISA